MGFYFVFLNYVQYIQKFFIMSSYHSKQYQHCPHRFNILILLRCGLESIKVVIHFPFDTRVRIDRQHPFVAGTSQSSHSTQ